LQRSGQSGAQIAVRERNILFSIPAVELKLPLLQCLLAFFPEGWSAVLTTLPNLAPKLRKSTSLPLLSPRPGPPMACNVATFNFISYDYGGYDEDVRCVLPMGKRYATGLL